MRLYLTQCLVPFVLFLLVVLLSPPACGQQVGYTLEADFTLGAGQWVYYRFVNDQVGQTVVIGLTAYTGDPDVYMAYTHNPTESSYDRAATQDGGGVISIDAPARLSVYYIGVKADGVWPATGSILVRAYNPADQQSNPVIISFNNPINDFLAARTYRYYQYTSAQPSNASLTFSLSPRIGDPDLYINSPNRTAWPSTGAYEYRRWSTGQDIITFRSTTNGIWRIAVYAVTDSQYQILINVGGAGTVLNLADGVVYKLQAYVNEWTWYRFTVPALPQAELNNMTLTFVGTALDSTPDQTTDIDLYCTDALSPLPTNQVGTYRWLATEWGSDSLVISGPLGQLHPGPYTCGAHPWNDVVFEMLAHFRSIIQLRDGVQIADRLEANTGMYYTYEMLATAPYSFTVSTLPAAGYHGIYIGGANQVALPTFRLNYVWKDDTTTYRGHSVLIPASSCPPTAVNGRCKYTILVWAYEATSYTLLAVNTTAPVPMTPGVVYYGSTAANEYRYFRFTITPDMTSASLILSTVDDADMWISRTQPYPTYTNKDWGGRTSYGEIVSWNAATYNSVFGKSDGLWTGIYYV